MASASMSRSRAAEAGVYPTSPCCASANDGATTAAAMIAARVISVCMLEVVSRWRRPTAKMSRNACSHCRRPDVQSPVVERECRVVLRGERDDRIEEFLATRRIREPGEIRTHDHRFDEGAESFSVEKLRRRMLQPAVDASEAGPLEAHCRFLGGRE